MVYIGHNCYLDRCTGPGKPPQPVICICKCLLFAIPVLSYSVLFPVKPYIINKDEFKNIVLKKNQTITLDIRFGGEPEPEVKWLKNGEEITADGDRYASVALKTINVALCHI